MIILRLQVKTQAGIERDYQGILSAVGDEVRLGEVPGQGGLEVKMRMVPDPELNAAEGFG